MKAQAAKRARIARVRDVQHRLAMSAAATAEAQVFATEAQALNVGVQRAQFEHAIAMLIGRPPAEVTIATYPLAGRIPKIPVSVPSTLLERRPDIAAAERTMQEQNALIGVAIAGYFPDISLSGILQWVGRNPLPFNVAHEVWSLGATGARLIVTLLHALEAQNLRRGIAALCIGGGEATAMGIELV